MSIKLSFLVAMALLSATGVAVADDARVERNPFSGPSSARNPFARSADTASPSKELAAPKRRAEPKKDGAPIKPAASLTVQPAAAPNVSLPPALPALPLPPMIPPPPLPLPPAAKPAPGSVAGEGSANSSRPFMSAAEIQEKQSRCQASTRQTKLEFNARGGTAIVQFANAPSGCLTAVAVDAEWLDVQISSAGKVTVIAKHNSGPSRNSTATVITPGQTFSISIQQAAAS